MKVKGKRKAGGALGSTSSFVECPGGRSAIGLRQGGSLVLIHIRSSEPFIDMILLDSYDPVTGLGLGSEGSRQDRPIENLRRGRGGLVANVLWRKAKVIES